MTSTIGDQTESLPKKAQPGLILLDWTVHPDTCTLRNEASGAEEKLSPRSMEVLIYLIENAGKVVSAKDLLGQFWSRSVRSDHAVHNVIAELRGALGDRASKPRYIKTYPKRGYALVPTPVFNSNTRSVERPQRRQLFPSLKRLSRRRLVGAGLGTVLLVLFWFGIGIPAETHSEAPRQKMLLVLPFDNVNSDENDFYLSKQLPGNLVSSLSKLPNALIVVSQGESSSPDSVEYLLSGNIQKYKDQHRVQVNLVDAVDNVIMYSDQFDFSSNDIFSVQDEIVQNVVAALSIILDDKLRSEMLDWGTSSPVAYDAFLKAEFHAMQSNHTDFRIALENYLLAVEADPDFVNAYLGLANSATKMGLYSHAEINKKMRKLDKFALRELFRIDPESDAYLAARILALRIEGTNQELIESILREEIMAGNAPEFVYSHYSTLLANARLYREAQDFLHLVSDDVPFEVSPDATWIYRSKVQTPENVIAIKKQELLERPSHLSVMGYLARSYAFLGDFERANYYLSQQLELDEEGTAVMMSQAIISGLYGASDTEADLFEEENLDNPDFNFPLGLKSFIRGDVQAGIERWRNLNGMETRRLLGNLGSIEIFMSDDVLYDARYIALLEELGMGISWQRHLMESVASMASVTGVPLSEPSRAAYDAGEFIVRNNLWDHHSIDYPQTLTGVFREPLADPMQSETVDLAAE